MSHPLVQEVAKLSQGFVRRGGKRNRRQQQRRMLAFADHAAVGGTKTLANCSGLQSKTACSQSTGFFGSH